jgi:hypothetical protein
MSVKRFGPIATMPTRLFAVFAFALTALVTAQENIKDPIKGFCRRHKHQTCIIDNKLYIDGGLVYYGTDVQPSSQSQTSEKPR